MNYNSIMQWLRTGTHSAPKCPVCREKTKRNDVVGPLFFTIPATGTTAGGQTTTMTTGNAEDTIDLSYAVDLQTNIAQAQRNLEEKCQQLDQANQLANRLKQQTIMLQTELMQLKETHSRTQMQLRYVKSLRG